MLDWVNRGITLRQKKYKGIFIGNSAVNKPPDDRPGAFSDSWVKAAKLGEFCAMKTEDLYVIHQLNLKGQLDTNEFWEKVFATNGIFDIRPYVELLTAEDGPEG